MRAYFINSKTDEHGPIEVEPSLKEYYRLIGCDCITIATREVNGHPFDIVLDDEGLLKPNRTSAFSVEADVFGTQEELVGNLLIFGSGEEDFRSLTDDEVLMIERRMIYSVSTDGIGHPTLLYTR